MPSLKTTSRVKLIRKIMFVKTKLLFVRPHHCVDGSKLARRLFEWGCRAETINEAVALELIPQHEIAESAVVHGVRWGNAEAAAYFMERDLKHAEMGSMYNRYHHESLLRGSQLWRGPIREASAQKRGHMGITPLHCACVNPNTSALRQLFAICPNPSVADLQQRKLAHYAAAAKGLEPLK